MNNAGKIYVNESETFFKEFKACLKKHISIKEKKMDKFKGNNGTKEMFLPLIEKEDEECKWLTIGIDSSIKVESQFKEKYEKCKIFGADPYPPKNFTSIGKLFSFGIDLDNTFNTAIVPINGSDVPKEVQVYSLPNLLINYIHSKTIYYLKMDIEGYEYKILESLVGNERYAHSGLVFCQISVNLHNPKMPSSHPAVKELNMAKECAIGMKWRIKEEVFREALATLNYEAIFSSVLKASSIPGLEYYLYLDSDAVDSSLNINLYLDFKMVKKVKATFTVSVKSANYQRIIVNHISDKTTDWGTICKEVLCARYQILDPKFKFFVDGYMEIELEGTLELISGIKKKPSRALSLAQLLWKSDDEKDVAFVVEDQIVKVHKWVLSANSPVFKAEMESGMKEAQEKKITVTDFSVEIVKIFVEYCYERDIRNVVNEENASELLHFSDKYDVARVHRIG
uniref:BTB domain-containing protein n=1 Tax=Panagrolaimus davidi TaxID=227884 RepID=A0A914PGG7_9BILA